MIFNNKVPQNSDSVRKTSPRIIKLPWQVWPVLLLGIFGGVGYVAVSFLFMNPKTPDCQRVFWPIASASLRLYCAQVDAQSLTFDGLIQAIDLVDVLPTDHPLRPEINRNIEEWSKDILTIAEKDFQAGKLEQAINEARKIPPQTKSHMGLENKIHTWQSVWQSGNQLLAKIDLELQKPDLNSALNLALEILNIKNTFWSTVQYNLAVTKIQLVQKQIDQLNLAQSFSRLGGVANLIKSIDLAVLIPSNSYVYKNAQNLILQNKKSIEDLVDRQIELTNWSAFKNSLDLIGTRTIFQEDFASWQVFLSAINYIQFLSPEAFENAIITLEQIQPTDRLYSSAQNSINQWKLAIDDLVYINKANQIAQFGTIKNYQDAIAQLQLIPINNPLFGYAHNQILKWQKEIQTIQDRPILDLANAIAEGGNGGTLSLQEAISQAQTIKSNRALYNDAQLKIHTWQSEIETIEDQPILDQALSLADNGQYARAVAFASTIKVGRSLYRDAQQKIKLWKSIIYSNQIFENANSLASLNTPESLSKAITLIQNLPSSQQDIESKLNVAINTWSSKLLNLATYKAQLSLYGEAIRIAKMIPEKSNVYISAKTKIDIWSKQLKVISPDSNINDSNPAPAH